MSAHRQSMHVTFKLVGASDDERESSPEALAPSICGWVLADHLDNTLMVFEAEGRYLGGSSRRTTWILHSGGTVYLAPPHRLVPRSISQTLTSQDS
jgi:hypothetical protein